MKVLRAFDEFHYKPTATISLTISPSQNYHLAKLCDCFRITSYSIKVTETQRKYGQSINFQNDCTLKAKNTPQ